LLVVFGMTFSEFIVLLLVAMVVLGPKELPRYLSKAGHLAGRARDWVRDIEDDRALVAVAFTVLAIMTVYLIGLAIHIR
jgi:Sec-independent protein translocase protein TatA